MRRILLSRWLCVLIAISVALTLFACGGDESPAGDREPAADDMPTVGDTTLPEELQGTFSRRLTRADIRKVGGSLAGPPQGLPLGDLEMTVEPDAVAFITHADGGDETLMFEVTLDRVEVTGGEYCEDPLAFSTYRWTRSGDDLLLEPIDNDCPDRQAVLAGSWTSD